MYRVSQAVYVIYIRVAASQEYLNTYSTRRPLGLYKVLVVCEAFLHTSILFYANTPLCVGSPPAPCIAHTIAHYLVFTRPPALQSCTLNTRNEETHAVFYS